MAHGLSIGLREIHKPQWRVLKRTRKYIVADDKTRYILMKDGSLRWVKKPRLKRSRNANEIQSKNVNH